MISYVTFSLDHLKSLTKVKTLIFHLKEATLKQLGICVKSHGLKRWEKLHPNGHICKQLKLVQVLQLIFNDNFKAFYYGRSNN